MDKKPQPPQHKPRAGSAPIRLGDAIKRVTTAVGIKPCKACQKRAERLNRLFSLRQSGRR